MVHYKLVYFKARGLAEISRQLFHLAGVEYEDHRIEDQEFAELKPNLPTGQVPILYIDNVPFSQSTAIARYCHGAKKCSQYTVLWMEAGLPCRSISRRTRNLARGE